MENPSKIIIGIDPDTAKSGFAVRNERSNEFAELSNYTFFGLFERLSHYKELNIPFVVLVEAGWLNQSNWHTDKDKSSNYNAKIGGYVGACNQVGKLIIEMCQYLGIDVRPIKPLKKKWAVGKISHGEIAKIFDNFPKKSNPEMRDAALITKMY